MFFSKVLILNDNLYICFRSYNGVKLLLIINSYVMEIISHRGFWKSENEKNSIQAFEESFKNNFGTETDLRDYKGKIVISHDIADENCIEAAQFFEIYNSFPTKPTLALNIKSDGLQKQLALLLEEHQITNYFTFDMSIPDTLGYLRNDIPFFSRQSEYEPTPCLMEECDGIWLDCFQSVWFDKSILANYLKNNKKVCLVSPELHKRDAYELWELLKKWELHTAENLILCTDFPDKARMFFE